jgi:hypothetical protein
MILQWHFQKMVVGAVWLLPFSVIPVFSEYSPKQGNEGNSAAKPE